MTLNTQQFKQLARLRVAVGLLGEQTNPRWWTSAFCSSNAKAFLAPVFPRTCIQAQYQGVVSAAAWVHDDRIGVGNVFHLFRLPEDIEQGLCAIAGEQIGPDITEVMQDADAARQFLSDTAGCVQGSAQGSARGSAQGPVKVGHLSALRNHSAWKAVAAFYLNGFEHQRETFPFFSDRT